MQGNYSITSDQRLATRLVLVCLLGFAMTTSTACSLFMSVEQEMEAPPVSEEVDPGEAGEASDDGAEDEGEGEDDEATADEAIDREGDAKSGDGPATRASLDDEALGNMTYIFNELPVTLSDGIYQEKPDETSATFITNLSVYQTAYGDLNGDGIDDAAVILLDAPGGSGSFLNLYGVMDQGSALTSTAGMFLGDRTKIEKFWVANGQMMMDVIRHGPDDPMCCPTEAATLMYVVQNGRIVEVATE
jgi:hypothetical protein